MWHDLGLWCVGAIAGAYIEWFYNKCEQKNKKRKDRKREWEREEEE